MSSPTRNQWRGYAVLAIVLAVALLVLLLLPRSKRQPATSGQEQLREAIGKYGDGIVEDNRQIRQSRYPQRRRDTNFSSAKPLDAERRDYPGYDRKDRYADVVVELNSADTGELQLLRGIGPVYASRIVRYRERLGGYVRKEQLLEVYGMDEERYAGIAEHIEVDTGLVRKLDINTASVAELKSHPYLDYYQARAIVSFRERAGGYNTMADLLFVNLIDEETIKKLRGYIQFK